MLSQMITMPFQRRMIIKELVNPMTEATTAETGEETTTISADVERLIIDDPAQLFSFVNLDSFTSKEIEVSLNMGY